MVPFCSLNQLYCYKLKKRAFLVILMPTILKNFLFTFCSKRYFCRNCYARLLVRQRTKNSAPSIAFCLSFAPHNDIEGAEANQEREVQKRRVQSLDAFRGLAIVVMIFVNYGGGGYYFFSHSPWNGITVADLVFPWFMWIMGVSLVISVQSQLRRSKSRTSMAGNVLYRSCILIFLGLIINSMGGKNDLRTFRLPGVLQRFGLTYCLVGLSEVFLAKPISDANAENPEGNSVKWWWSLRDVKLGQWTVGLLLVSLHCILTFCLPIPGCPTGYLGPGGLAQNGRFYNCTGGSARVIDIAIFGQSHIYQNPTAKQVYATNQPYDPEGLLGTLTSAFIVFMGVQCGNTLLTFNSWQPRVRRWLLWAFVLGSIAGGLCGFSKDQGVIPLNKNLWSLSFVCSMGSMAFLLFTIMYLLIDVLRIWDGSPLSYAGMNSILLYVGHETCEEFFPFSWQPFSQSHGELLFMNIWGASLWIFISYALFKKKVFLSL